MTISKDINIQKNSLDEVSFDREGIKSKLLNLDRPCYVFKVGKQIGIANRDINNERSSEAELLLQLPPLPPQQLGDANFRTFHGVKYAYVAGAMASGISSEELVIALGREKILSSFGAGGLQPSRTEAAIHRIQLAIPEGPYAFNLLHSPNEPERERAAVDLYLRYGVRTVEASAFLDLTPNIVYYRAAGLCLYRHNEIKISNKVIAKLSRTEVATKFLKPVPTKILQQLVSQGLISELQANLAQKVPMADDITVEADSGGHTDNRPLVCLFPSIVSLRNEIQQQYNYSQPVRIGVAGGIATSESALAAFIMGAAYVVTRSINQSCIEAGTCQHTKQLLARATMTDVMMAPAADMFEMGVKLQVIKKNTLFPVRAQKLYDIYKEYNSIDDIPASEREKLEKQIFRKSLDEVWQEIIDRYTEKNPERSAQAQNNPKRKMSLIFRWYLGLSSRWGRSGEAGREIDYQIWCGPAMGSFNDWVKGSYLAEAQNRTVVDIAHHIVTGAAYLYRVQNMKMQGLEIPSHYSHYFPNR